MTGVPPHAGRRGRPSWARGGVAALAMSLPILSGGCGVIAHEVRFSPTPSFEPPIAATSVVVNVLDGTSQEQGIPLGRLTTPYSGGPEHRYVVIGEDSFAARLARDVVAALRARGYRAQARSDTGSEEPADVIVSIRPVTHSIDIVVGATDVVFHGAFVFECAATVGGSPVWSEAIDHQVQKRHFGSMTSRGAGRAFEGVYWAAVVEIVRRFSIAWPPSP